MAKLHRLANASLLLSAIVCVLGEETCAAAGARETVALSTAPRVYLLEDFLRDGEGAHLQALAAEMGVVAETAPDPSDSQDNRGYHQEYIDESRYDTDPLLLALEERIAGLAHIPRDPGAGATISLAVRNASQAGLTNLHHDHNAAALALLPFVRQGRRVPLTELRATLLAYLTDVEEGGETIFPCVCSRSSASCRKAQAACKFLYEHGVFNVHEKGHNTPFREAGQLREKLRKAAKLLVSRSNALCLGESSEGLKVQARTGRAILFFSNSVRGLADPRVWHGSCRVVKGQKMAMQRFLYAPQSEEETGEHAAATFNW